AVRGRFPHHRERAALALADGAEALQIARRDRKDVALLRLVAPDLERRHARLLVRNPAQVEAAAAVRRMHQLRQRVGQASRPDIMYGENRVSLSQRPAAVYDLLRAALDLGVATLHRV